MFYNMNLMNSSSLGVPWRLANQVSLHTGDADLRDVCSSLNRWVVSGRMSLRTSSVLTNGAVKMYKEKADNLYRDIININNEILKKSKRKMTQSTDMLSDSTKEDSREHTIENVDRRECSYNQKRSSRRNRSKDPGTCNSSSSNSLVSKSSTINIKDKSTQTTKSLIANKRRKQTCRRKQCNVDRNVPHVWSMVYDENGLPTKIIYCNINTNVKLSDINN